MRNRCARVMMVTTGLWLAVATVSGQAPYRAPRTGDGKANLNGIWQALNTANWDIETHSAAPGLISSLGASNAVPGGLGVVDGEIPYRARGAREEERELREPAEAGPGDQVLSAGRAARHLHAVSVSDHSEPEAHHDRP